MVVKKKAFKLFCERKGITIFIFLKNPDFNNIHIIIIINYM